MLEYIGPNRIRIAGLEIEVKSEAEILRIGGVFVVLPVKYHPDSEPIPGSRHIRCSLCTQSCWIAPSGQRLQTRDFMRRLPPVCMDCFEARRNA